MSASHPGRVRRFFRGALARRSTSAGASSSTCSSCSSLVARRAGVVRSGPAPSSPTRRRSCSTSKGSDRRAARGNLRRRRSTRCAATRRRRSQLRDVLAVLDAAAERPEDRAASCCCSTNCEGAGLATLHEIGAAIDRFKARRQAGRGLGLAATTSASTTSAAHAERGLPAPDGHGDDRRLRRLPQLLPRRARQARRDRQPDASVGTYKSFAEPYIANGPSPAAQRGRHRPLRRAVERPTRTTSRRRASCRPGSDRARHRRGCRSCWPRRAATPAQAGAATTSWSTA